MRLRVQKVGEKPQAQFGQSVPLLANLSAPSAGDNYQYATPRPVSGKELECYRIIPINVSSPLDDQSLAFLSLILGVYPREDLFFHVATLA